MNQTTDVLKTRITSIDLLRGLVMVIMALDHVRDYFHVQAMTGNPTDMSTTTPLLFFTRWITHFCAPVFVFLSGTSIYLQGLRKTKAELSLFLLKRGLWLVFAEFFIIALGWTFNPLYHTIILQVIWTIGISMVIMALLVRLPFAVILIIGLVIVCGHNLFDYSEASPGFKSGFIWDLVHHGEFRFYKIFGEHYLMILYPFGPWVGVMALGYCLGKFFEPGVTGQRRRRELYQLGFGIIVFFIFLRFSNTYGDRDHWEVQRNGFYTFLSFLNTTKYPPSFLYLCMTLGPAIIALAVFENIRNKAASFFMIFGRVPFFYYILHLFLIHGLLVICFYLSGYGAKDIVPDSSPFLFRPTNFGYSLKIVYLIWISVVLILYPFCKWYNRYKGSHKQWWLSYL
jgi:uncharacterized membrane protein